MRSASTSVVNYLNGIIAGNYPPEAMLCELFTFTPAGGGTPIYMTSLDQNVTWRTTTFGTGGSISPQNNPYAQRVSWRNTATLEVDQMDLQIGANPSMTLNNVPFLAALRRGDLDSAWVLVERFIFAPCQVSLDSTGLNATLVSGPPFSIDEWPTGSGIHPLVGSTAFVDGRMVNVASYSDSSHCVINPGGRASQTVRAMFPVGTVTIFAGLWSEIQEINRTSAKATVKSGLVKLTNTVPRKMFGPTCSHTLFDAGCGLIQANYEFTGSVQSGTTAFVVHTNLTPPGPINPPAAAPTFSFSSPGNVNIPEATYFIRQSYVYALGETPAGPQTEAIASGHPNYVLTVHSPAAASGATGWNCYIATDTGPNMLQNSAPIAIGTDWVEGQTGTTTGLYPPVTSSPGYFAQGWIQFTSGALKGLRFAISGNSGGQLTLEVPLPSVPAVGDTFIAVPGCELTMSACTYKFASDALGGTPGSNLVHFGGTPFVPQPEKGFVGQGQS